MDDDLSVTQADKINEIRNNLLQFILNNATSKFAIKLSDLHEVGGKNARLFNQCFAVVRETLQATYGILMKEVPESKSGRKFICYSEITACSHLEYDNEQNRQLTLLFLIVSYIFMCDLAVGEEQLEQFLKGLGINWHASHEFFGDNLKKLICDIFVRQLYLKREKSESELQKESTYVYSLGFRSIIEFRAKALLEATAKILGRPSKMFVSQHKKAYNDGENA